MLFAVFSKLGLTLFSDSRRQRERSCGLFLVLALSQYMLHQWFSTGKEFPLEIPDVKSTFFRDVP